MSQTEEWQAVQRHRKKQSSGSFDALSAQIANIMEEENGRNTTYLRGLNATGVSTKEALGSAEGEVYLEASA